MTIDNQWTSRTFGGNNEQGNFNPPWSPFMKAYNRGNCCTDPAGVPGPTRSFSSTITFQQTGFQVFRTAADDTGTLSVNGNTMSTGPFTGFADRTTNNVVPAGTYTITGTTTNGGGGPWGISAQWLRTDPPPNPTVSLNRSPSNVCAGDTSTLSWSVSGFSITSRILTGGGLNQSVGSSGSLQVQPGTYTLTATNAFGGSTSRTRTVGLIDPTEVNFIGDDFSIVFPDSAVLQWSSTGQNNDSTIDQGIGDVNNSGSVTVSPTETTTYTITTTGTCNTDTDSITVTVYYQPEATLTEPTSVNYGNPLDLEIDYQYADGSVTLEKEYIYLRDGGTVIDTETFDITGPYGSNSITFTDTPPYNTLGPNSIEYSLTVTGSGGSFTTTKFVDVIIDQIPNALNILDTDNKLKDENPVFAPDTVVTSIPLTVNDIDIPVEITANRPIKVSLDEGVTFVDIKETP